jgi:CPA2 family monovalent cation:H+ antiporter-2
MTVIAARAINPKLPVIVRAATEEGVGYLSELGADHIIHPELEGGLEMVHHTLLQLGYPLREVHEYAEGVRRDRYNIQISSSDEHRSLHDLVVATDSIEITWLTIDEGILSRSNLVTANIRSRTGVSVIGIIRAGRLIANPKSSTKFDG